MKISVIGAGYVGLVTAAGLARLGHEVRLGEADKNRLALLEAGQVPIFEEGLADLVTEARQSRMLTYFGSNGEAALGSRLVFLCLPTPTGAGGRADLSFIDAVIDELALTSKRRGPPCPRPTARPPSAS